MNNYQRTADWLAACGKQPTVENLSVQIGCDLEETLELIECLEFSDGTTSFKVATALNYLTSVAQSLKSGAATAYIPKERREDALDALCDREVTGNGVAFLAGFKKPAADAAVLDANDAKLVDGKPVILQGGKIGKPAGWKAADLREFV